MSGKNKKSTPVKKKPAKSAPKKEVVDVVATKDAIGQTETKDVESTTVPTGSEESNVETSLDEKEPSVEAVGTPPVEVIKPLAEETEPTPKDEPKKDAPKDAPKKDIETEGDPVSETVAMYDYIAENRNNLQTLAAVAKIRSNIVSLVQSIFATPTVKSVSELVRFTKAQKLTHVHIDFDIPSIPSAVDRTTLATGWLVVLTLAKSKPVRMVQHQNKLPKTLFAVLSQIA